MTRYAIDAPTLVHLVANEVQVSSRHQIVAPHLIRSEALSLLFEAVRRGDLDEDLALRYHERLTELNMRLLGPRITPNRLEDGARGRLGVDERRGVPRDREASGGRARHRRPRTGHEGEGPRAVGTPRGAHHRLRPRIPDAEAKRYLSSELVHWPHDCPPVPGWWERAWCRANWCAHSRRYGRSPSTRAGRPPSPNAPQFTIAP